MNFQDIIKKYTEPYNISVSELSDASGLSKATISRLKNGKQTPQADSSTLVSLSEGISIIINKKNATATQASTPTADNILKELQTSLDSKSDDFIKVVNNLNSLIYVLNLNINSLSRHMNYDASYLSRIRKCQRKPSNISQFCAEIADYVATRHIPDYSGVLAQLTGLSVNDFSDAYTCRKNLAEWLSKNNKMQDDDSMKDFLTSLDLFDLGEYMCNAGLNLSASVPENDIMKHLLGSNLSQSKNYYTINGFMEAELDWLRDVICSDSVQSVLFFSDMPMSEISRNSEFASQWMLYMAMLLKKGVRINIIHNIDRSFPEMMLGLHSWIPLYMTGLVSPYYLKGYNDTFFHHFLRISDISVLSGEAIVGFHSEGMYHLDRRQTEVSYYNRLQAQLLSKANSLMDIYYRENADKFSAVLFSMSGLNVTYRRNILSAPPLYTLDKELASEILAHNNISDTEKNKILELIDTATEYFEGCITDGVVEDEMPELSEEEFTKRPVILPLFDLFFENEITYTYAEYRKHIQLTRQKANNTTGYRCKITGKIPFRNIQIRILPGHFAIVSKSKSPTIHFVIKHPKLLHAIEQLIIE